MIDKETQGRKRMHGDMEWNKELSEMVLFSELWRLIYLLFSC